MQWDAIWIRWIKKRYDKSARFELQTAIFLNCSSFHALFPYDTFTGQFDSHFKPKTIYLSVVQNYLIYKKPGKIFEMVLRLHFCPNSHHTCTEASSILIQRSAFEHWKWSNRFMNKNKKFTLKLRIWCLPELWILVLNLFSDLYMPDVMLWNLHNDFKCYPNKGEYLAPAC